MEKIFILFVIGAIYFGKRCEGQPFMKEVSYQIIAIFSFFFSSTSLLILFCFLITIEIKVQSNPEEKFPGIFDLLKQSEPSVIAVNNDMVVGALAAIGGSKSDVHKKATIEYGPNKIIIDTTTLLGCVEINIDNTTLAILTPDDFKFVVKIGTLVIHSKNFDGWTKLLTQWRDSLQHLRMIRERRNYALFALSNYFLREPPANLPNQLKSVEVSVVQTYKENQVAVKNAMAFLADKLSANGETISFTQPMESDDDIASFWINLCPSGWSMFTNKCTIGCRR